jgi:hypothetical protein
MDFGALVSTTFDKVDKASYPLQNVSGLGLKVSSNPSKRKSFAAVKNERN